MSVNLLRHRIWVVLLSHCDTYLKCCKHEHLLFSTIDLFVEKLPFGLLIDLIDSHAIVFWVQVIERVELEAQAKCVVLPYTLLHDWEWRVQPTVEMQSFSKINLICLRGNKRQCYVYSVPISIVLKIVRDIFWTNLRDIHPCSLNKCPWSKLTVSSIWAWCGWAVGKWWIDTPIEHLKSHTVIGVWLISTIHLPKALWMITSLPRPRLLLETKSTREHVINVERPSRLLR